MIKSAVLSFVVAIAVLAPAQGQPSGQPAGQPSGQPTGQPSGQPQGQPRGNKGGKMPGECRKVAEACRQAGFKQGDWKKGDGLWRDCVDPLMQGQTSVPGASKPLPTVDPKIVADCKAKHPKYGGGKVGSQP